jgi:hypothetical protein
VQGVKRGSLLPLLLLLLLLYVDKAVEVQGDCWLVGRMQCAGAQGVQQPAAV